MPGPRSVRVGRAWRAGENGALRWADQGYWFVLPLLVLPLMAPVVIFGSGAVRAWQLGVDPAAPLYFLGSLFALSATALPWACASALRNAYD